jgi:hypothetical protein
MSFGAKQAGGALPSLVFSTCQGCRGHAGAIFLAAPITSLSIAITVNFGYNDARQVSQVSKQVYEGLAGGISRYEVRDELKRVLLSRHFIKAKKKSRFLEFMCEQALSGKASAVNEYTIGADIYERGPDFNPQEDSIVRVQAHEIRKSIGAYYEDEGRDDRVRIDLPVGGYVPVFTRVEERPDGPTPGPEPWAASLRQPRYAMILAVCVVCALATGWFARDQRARSTAQAPMTHLPAGATWFWEPFLPPAAPPLVVLPVHPLLRAAHAGDSAAIWDRGQVIGKDKLPEFRDTIHFRELPTFRFVPNTTDFTAVGEALGLLRLSEFLAGGGQKIRANAGRLVDYEAVKSGNTILLGGNQSWSGRIFLYSDGFEFHNGVIENRKPLAGEQPEYRPEFDPVTGNLSRDYALVLILPNERRDQRVLLIYGIYTQGSQAAIEYVTNAETLAELRKSLADRSLDHKSLPKFFQVLLATSVENFVPGKVSLVSTRIIPE